MNKDNKERKQNNQTASVTATLQHHVELLKKEYEYEKETFKQQSETAGIVKKIKSGMCWFPLTVNKSYYNSLNQFIVEIERNDDLGRDHQFEYGRSVRFFTHTPQGNFSYYNFSATVNYAEENKMLVVIPGAESLATIQSGYNLGVQLYFDESIYKLMFAAMDNLINSKEKRLSELRDIMYGTQPLEEFTFAPTRFPWLNSSQEMAVNKVLHAKDVAIVHGPPGTGKTTTFVEAIYETLQRENQVLVCAQSNMAVDWISEKLIERGVPVLRIGNPNRVNDTMLQYTYEHRFESHPDYPQLWSIRKAIRELYTKMRSGGGNEREKIRLKINSLKDRGVELEIRINNSLFAEARVIASTLTGSANNVLNGYKFGTLFIDEAAQALEAACWIAIQKADRVIMAGDHCQLPPTIKCMEAMRGGLANTLMQQVIHNKPQCVSLLTTQYRMNEEIMHFSSEWFYGGKLEAAKEVKYRGILDYDTPIEWIDTSEDKDDEIDFSETQTDNSGRINKAEALLSVEVVKNYINKIGRERIKEENIDFGIISPYKAQVQYLRKLIKKDAFFKPYLKAITINTVDGFQGQERDVIMISLVRANEKGEIGFLNDLRRMNVAITRARMKLIILGNSETLTRTPFYKRLYEYVESLD